MRETRDAKEIEQMEAELKAARQTIGQLKRKLSHAELIIEVQKSLVGLWARHRTPMRIDRVKQMKKALGVAEACRQVGIPRRTDYRSVRCTSHRVRVAEVSAAVPGAHRSSRSPAL